MSMAKETETCSVCPECLKRGQIKKLKAERKQEEGGVYLVKECPEHGKFKSIISDEPKQYEKFQNYWETGSNKSVETFGLYDEHKSQTVLTNLFVTNRCELRCAYCFANSGAEGFVYEPSLKEIEKMMKKARSVKPVPSKAIQLTGGEPSVREDLVETVINGINDDQLGDIIKFAADNIDIVRGVNFQPVSFVGRIENLKDKEINEKRISFSEVHRKIEKQTNGQIKVKDWYPPAFVNPISDLVESLKGEPQVRFGCSPNCGSATYLIVEDGKLLPITEFVDVEKMMNFLKEKSKFKGKLGRVRLTASLLKNISSFVDSKKAPKDFSLKRLLVNAIVYGSYEELSKFHKRTLYVGGMWFQDAWNMDFQRLERCVIHYATEEGIVPFCTYNGLGYGAKIRKKYGIPIKEWEKQTGRKIKDDLWKGKK
ncbi:MAG: hypothetical protein B6D55_06995 [Candidatus Omnitrophica bacterium 4484_70.2]|nr:MAG: hypothetical protein B6D55_06995 [Candidatus Omnitrophica bacterium 4484_70.2]